MATVGDTTVESTFAALSTAPFELAVGPFVAGGSGALTSLSAYIDGNAPGAAGSQPFRIAIRADNAGVPGTLLDATTTLTCTLGQAAGWVTSAQTLGGSVSSGQSYWLSIWNDNGTAGTATVRYVLTTSSGPGFAWANTGESPLPSSWPGSGGSGGSTNISIYATFGSAAPPVYFESPIAAIMQVCANGADDGILELVNPPQIPVASAGRIPFLILTPLPTAQQTPVPVYPGAANAYPGEGLAPGVLGLVLVPVAP